MAKKEKEVSALSAVIAYFVMNTAINAMLINNGLILEMERLQNLSLREQLLPSAVFSLFRWAYLEELL